MKEQSATMIKITETTVRGDEHEAPVDRTFQTADEAKAFLKDRLTEWYEEQGLGPRMRNPNPRRRGRGAASS